MAKRTRINDSSLKNKFTSIINEIIDERLEELEDEGVIEAAADKSVNYKQRVNRFFDRLEKHSISKYLNFKTPQEQAQSIMRFAQLVGVPRSRFAKIMSSLRTTSKNEA